MKITVLTGAGISAESGLKTFRDSNGLWEGHDVMEVASPQGWQTNPTLVLNFYNQRRKQLLEVTPNKAHFAIADLEKEHDVRIITQNVDDLHERAGSKDVLHLHGELLKVRSTNNKNNIKHWTQDIKLGDFCEEGHQLRPHIVWFGEEVPEMENAVNKVLSADILLIVGTSMQVYPAAGLIEYASFNSKIFFVDKNPTIIPDEKITVIAEKATLGVPKAIQLINNL